ncbi:glutathione S-transferase-like protein [Tanacetum coccineum]
MAIKLYGSLGSDTTQRVLACLYEKEVDFELVIVDTVTGEHKTPQFLARNPFGEVPALEDDHVTLFESRAITQYIAHKYADKGTNLIMEDPSKLAIQTVWMDVENQRFDLPFTKLLDIAMQGTRSQEAGCEYEKMMFNVLDVYEARLKKSNYLGGDSFTMADLHHLPGVHFLRATKVKGWFQGRPHVRAWAANILSRPAWVKVAAIPLFHFCTKVSALQSITKRLAAATTSYNNNMTVKIYGFIGSNAVFRALACLYEKDVDFEFVTVKMHLREHKSPAYLAMSPFGQVPAFVDGDITLFESRAITQYIARKYTDQGTELIMKDPIKLAIQTVWMEVENQKFDRATWKRMQIAAGRIPGGPGVVAEYEKKLSEVLDVYEKRLTESKYLGGDTFTLADLHHIPNIDFLYDTRVKMLFEARPHVRAWAAGLLSRPAWLKVMSMS